MILTMALFLGCLTFVVSSELASENCFNIRTITFVDIGGISWTLGTCTGSQYGAEKNVYVEECCLEPGVYTLNCLDIYGDGWNYFRAEYAYFDYFYHEISGITTLWIQGVEYCGDFLEGYSHSENITIITEPTSDNCFNVTISTKSRAYQYSWHLGHCAGAQQYRDQRTYTEECCLEIGDYELTCLDASGDSWSVDGFTITIDGVAYCSDFTDGFIYQEHITISNIPAGECFRELEANECPCIDELWPYPSCDLDECSSSMFNGQFCETNGITIDGQTLLAGDNCPGKFDVWIYECDDAPTSSPILDPSSEPTSSPTFDPTNLPTSSPTLDPSSEPTSSPTLYPTNVTTSFPTLDPSSEPTSSPTFYPTNVPMSSPTLDPSSKPTSYPTFDPTNVSTNYTAKPSSSPTLSPTNSPTSSLTFSPTNSSPTEAPTEGPTVQLTTEGESEKQDMGGWIGGILAAVCILVLGLVASQFYCPLQAQMKL